MKKLINEQLAITRTNPIKARLYDYPRFTYPWHFHSEYEFIFIEKGKTLSLQKRKVKKILMT